MSEKSNELVPADSKAVPSRAKVTMTEGENGPKVAIEMDANHALHEAFPGQKDQIDRLLQVVFNQTSYIFPYMDNEASMEAALDFMENVKPKDAVELLLCTQMLAVHNVALEMSRRILLPDQTVDGAERCVNRATKLMRTFTAQVEALNRYRGKTSSEQKIVVEHVTVNEGGQAIVGPVVSKGEGGGKQHGRQPQ